MNWFSLDSLLPLGYKQDMEHNNGRVGQKVLFGRKHGEQTPGVIVKVNPKKFKVRQLEARGAFVDHPVGTVWTVPASLCTLIDPTAPLMPMLAPVRRKRTLQNAGLGQQWNGQVPLMTREEALAQVDQLSLAEITNLLRANRLMARSERERG